MLFDTYASVTAIFISFAKNWSRQDKLIPVRLDTTETNEQITCEVSNRPLKATAYNLGQNGKTEVDGVRKILCCLRCSRFPTPLISIPQH